MILIDSVYTKSLGELRDMPDATAQPIVKSPEELSAMPLREKVDLNMTHARMMAVRWELPDWSGRETEIPQTILLRAKELFQADGQSFVDHSRKFRLLGWDQYHGACWIKEVVDLDGHHFNIFDEKYVSACYEWLWTKSPSDEIGQCCAKLYADQRCNNEDLDGSGPI